MKGGPRRRRGPILLATAFTIVSEPPRGSFSVITPLVTPRPTTDARPEELIFRYADPSSAIYSLDGPRVRGPLESKHGRLTVNKNREFLNRWSIRHRDILDEIFNRICKWRRLKNWKSNSLINTVLFSLSFVQSMFSWQTKIFFYNFNTFLLIHQIFRSPLQFVDGQQNRISLVRRAPRYNTPDIIVRLIR